MIASLFGFADVALVESQPRPLLGTVQAAQDPYGRPEASAPRRCSSGRLRAPPLRVSCAHRCRSLQGASVRGQVACERLMLTVPWGSPEGPELEDLPAWSPGRVSRSSTRTTRSHSLGGSVKAVPGWAGAVAPNEVAEIHRLPRAE